jgi:RND family efflux transporter MFP subunit
MSIINRITKTRSLLHIGFNTNQKALLLISSLFLLLIFNSSFAKESTVEAKPAVKQETLSGFTRARTRLTLSAESSGRVFQVNYETGDKIAEEKPFACLDDTFLDLDIRTNNAERKSLEVDIDFYRKEVSRYRKLLKKNSSSQIKMDTAKRNLNKTQTQHEALSATAAILQEKKKRLCIQPPADWHVIQRHVDNGKWVSIGEPIVEVGDYSHLTVPFALSMVEFKALKEKEGKGLKVTLPDINLDIPAKLIKISPAFDQYSRKIHLELELYEGLTSHRGGLRVELSLDIPMYSGAVLVPEKSLTQRYEQYWLKRPDGEEVSVVYLGKSLGSDDKWVRVVSPEVNPGDLFLVQSN